jgi:hypothetical protein
MSSKSLELVTVEELKCFLRERRMPLGSGNKAHLYRLAKLFKDKPIFDKSGELTPSEQALADQRTIFDLSDNVWNDIATISSQDIPVDYDITVLVEFLTKSLYLAGDGEQIQSGTEKPAAKGRRMYKSGKFQFCETSSNDDHIMFRAIMEASMIGKKFR